MRFILKRMQEAERKLALLREERAVLENLERDASAGKELTRDFPEMNEVGLRELSQ